MQGRDAVRALGVDGRVVRQQQIDDVLVALVGRRVQRRHLGRRLRVRVGALGKQLLDLLVLPLDSAVDPVEEGAHIREVRTTVEA